MTTTHLAHVRVRHFDKGNPVVAIECEKRPRGDISTAALWMSGDMLTARPQDADWLTVYELTHGGDVSVYTAAADLWSFEIRPLFTGVTGVQKEPRDELFHALKDRVRLATVADASTFSFLCEHAFLQASDTESVPAYQGVFFVCSFQVESKKGDLCRVSFDSVVSAEMTQPPEMPELVAA